MRMEIASDTPEVDDLAAFMETRGLDAKLEYVPEEEIDWDDAWTDDAWTDDVDTYADDCAGELCND